MSTTPDSRPAGISRRNLLMTGAAASAALTIVPRHVLGGPGFVAPSEKINLAYIGCGTQGIREMIGMLSVPDIRIAAVCDPVKGGHDYVDWSRDGNRSAIGEAMGKPDWRRGTPGIPGGRDVAKELIETVYARDRQSQKYSGCATYADFRELLDREKDIDAVKIMTPDHLHATVAIAAMRKGKHVMVHKPLANRLHEGRLVVETARRSRVATHFLPASDGANIRRMKAWVDDGAIGKRVGVRIGEEDGLPDHTHVRLAFRPGDVDRVTDVDACMLHGVCTERDLVGSPRLVAPDDRELGRT